VFTGLIKELGEIRAISLRDDGIVLRIAAPELSANLKRGGSVNINGACQTAFNIDKSEFEVFATGETVTKTNFGSLRQNEVVNLELPLTLEEPLGGHLVLGHVDCKGEIISLNHSSRSANLQIKFDSRYSSLLVEKGSIAVDGISLTCFDISDYSFSVAVIPETIKSTNLQYRKAGDSVNLEFDIFAKYIQKSITKQQGSITLDYLNQHGFEVKYD
jgi:riboflavin synthase